MNDILHPYYNYYSKNGIRYSTKMKAQIAATQPHSNATTDPILWHIPAYERALDAIDVSQEPTESIQSMYLARARQLRNQYDWLVLHYSGGCDSHNILETFAFNEIQLDEIIVYDNLDTDDDRELYIMNQDRGDITEIGIPMARYFVKTHMPHTKLTIIKNAKVSHLRFWESVTPDKYVHYITGCVDQLLGHRQVVRMLNPQQFNADGAREWQKLKERKKVAYIYGHEKPRVLVDDVGIYLALTDSMFQTRFTLDGSHLASNGIALDEQQLPYNCEYFYLHPQFVKMYVKGCHMLVRNTNIDRSYKLTTGRAEETRIGNILYRNRYPIVIKTGLKGYDMENEAKTTSVYDRFLKLGGRLDTGDPFFFTTILRNNSTAAQNYTNFAKFVHNTFFKNYTFIEMIHLLGSPFPIGKRYYIKKWNT